MLESDIVFYITLLLVILNAIKVSFHIIKRITDHLYKNKNYSYDQFSEAKDLYFINDWSKIEDPQIITAIIRTSENDNRNTSKVIYAATIQTHFPYCSLGNENEINNKFQIIPKILS